MQKSGIYIILNKANSKFYIGSSKVTRDRWNRHKKDLRNGIHHSIILQRAWNKYGENNFIFEILEECSVETLLEREQNYLNILKPIYNICTCAGSSRGVKQSPEACAKKRKYALENNVIPPKETWEKAQKPVYMLNENKEIINEFISISSACRFIGRNGSFSTCITRAIKREIKAYGYYWKWK